VHTTITDPEIAPTAKLGFPVSNAVMKKIVSGAVFNHEITKPPIIVASYLSPRISPPSDTHHAPKTSSLHN
jgi:hypothetical protein